jgi:hypothetical protein
MEGNTPSVQHQHGPQAIHRAMLSIMKDLQKNGGIKKNRRNEDQNFDFRGIEDIQNAVAPLLVKYNVLIIPSFAEPKMESHLARNKATTLFRAWVLGHVDFISVEDGSSLRISLPGEAMDTGDKSTTKAMSIAVKVACLFGFFIPTKGIDPDATSFEVSFGDQKGKIHKNDPSHGQNGRQNGGPPERIESAEIPTEIILKRRPSMKVTLSGRSIKTAGITSAQLKRIWDAAEGNGEANVKQLLEQFGLGKSVKLATYLTEEEAKTILKDLALPQPNGHPVELPV